VASPRAPIGMSFTMKLPGKKRANNYRIIGSLRLCSPS
jgi:hypothetical protein